MKGKPSAVPARAALSILGAGGLWGCIGVFYKLLTAAGLDSMQAVAVRVLAAAALYFVYLLFTDRAALRIRLRDLWCFLGTGLCSLVFFNWCYFNAISRSSMGVAAVLLYTAPIFVMLMSAALFGEALTPQKLAALALAFGGCALVSGVLGGGAVPAAAIGFGLGAGFGYALYSIFGKFALRRYSSKTVTAWSFFVAAAGVLPLTRFAGIPAALAAPKGFCGMLGISILCCILPYVLYTAGLSGVEAGRASLLATVEPVVAAVLGIALYGEAVTPQKLAGIACVVGAVALLSFRPGARAEKESPALAGSDTPAPHGDL